MAGRPPKPTLIHKIEGTGRNHRLKKRANEVKPSPSPLEPPDWLKGDALAMWNELTTNSGYAKALNSTHKACLATFCMIWGEVCASQQPGAKPISSERLKTMHSYGMKFGLTPSDAVKVHTPQEEKPEDPWAKLG